MAGGGFDIPQAIVTTANQYGVDPALALSVAHAESNLNPTALSPKGAVGVMQLMPDTAAGLGVDPRDVHQNIIGGVKYLKQLHDQFGGDPRMVAAAYNAGPGAVSAHGGVPPFPETQAYVDKVVGPDTSAMPSADDIEAHLSGSPPSSAPADDGQPGIEITINKSTNPEFLAWKAAHPHGPEGAEMPSADDIEKQLGIGAEPAAAAPPTLPGDPSSQAAGFMANLNHGSVVGDQLVAHANAFGSLAGDFLAGRQHVDPNDPYNSLEALKAKQYAASLARQQGLQAGYQAEHPHLAALGRGLGTAGAVAATELTGGSLAPTSGTSALEGVSLAPTGSRLGNMARGATTALGTSAALSAADAGTPQERLAAASDAASPWKHPFVTAIGALSGALAPTAAKTTNALTGEVGPSIAEKAAQFDQANVRPSYAAVGGPGAATAAKVAASNALVGGRARNALAGSLQDTANEAERIAQSYGEARGPQITGENVQQGVQTFARDKSKPSTFAAKSEQLYDRAFSPIQTAEGQAVERSQNDFAQRSAQAKATAEQQAALRGETNTDPVNVAPQRPVVTPSATITTLRQLAGRVNAPNLSNLITDSRVRSIADALGKDAPDVRFNDLRQLRTWVRNAQGNPDLRQGITSAGLQQLEQSMTTDIYDNAARLGGPKALQALQRADDYYRAGSSRIKTALQPFADAKSGENAYSRIISAAGSTAGADAQKLLSLKRSLAPGEWGDVASNVVSQLGKPTSGAAHGGDFSVNQFVTNYAKLSPRARSILFDSVGGGGAKATELRGALDNLANVAGMQKGVEAAANHSNTAVHGQTAAMLGALGTSLLHPVAVGVPAALTLAGEAITGEMMTNPAVVRALAKRAAAKTPQAAQQATTALQQVMARSPRAVGVYGTGTSGTPSVARAPTAAPNALSGVSPAR